MINADTIIDELKNINSLFLINDKNGMIINNKNYIYKKGKIPILLSASHAVKQQRENQIKLSDYLTGAIAIYLANKCNCSYFVRIFNDNSDPNYPLGITLKNINDSYLVALKNFIQDYEHILVIDIHGCNNNKEYDCSMWSNNYKTCEEEIINVFKNNFNNANLSTDDGFEYLGGQVTRQCSLIANAFQLEVKRKIRTLKIEDYNLLKSFLYSMEISIYNINDNTIKLRRCRNEYR